MLCHNCSYILSGKENFCPNCGSMPYGQIKETEKKATDAKKEQPVITPESYPPYTPAKPYVPPAKASDIFADTLESVNDEKSDMPKNPVGKIFVLLFLTCTLAVTAFGLADYFGITKTVSGFVQTLSQKESGKTEDSPSAFDHKNSIEEPEINYSMSTAYILSGSTLTLRKGPSNSYAPLHLLQNLTRVQIFGGSLASPDWVYVYCPEKECYGWLDGSYLSPEGVTESEAYHSEETPFTAQNTVYITDTEPYGF